jgi:hypothetical protein
MRTAQGEGKTTKNVLDVEENAFGIPLRENANESECLSVISVSGFLSKVKLGQIYYHDQTQLLIQARSHLALTHTRGLHLVRT